MGPVQHAVSTRLLGEHYMLRPSDQPLCRVHRFRSGSSLMGGLVFMPSMELYW